MKRLLIPLLILPLFLAAPGAVSAQTVGLSLSPPVVEILLAPNKQVVQTFNLKNQGESVEIVPTLHLVTPVGDEGHVKLDPRPVSPAAIPLVARLTPHAFGQAIPLKEGGTLTLTLTLAGATVDAPVDTYLALLLTPHPLGNSLGLTSAAPALSGLIFVTLTPSAAIPASLELGNFEPGFLHDTALPFTLSPTLKNNSGIMLHPAGKLTITSARGETVHQTDLESILLLGSSARELKHLTWSPSWRNFGPHRVRLTFSTVGGTVLTDVERTVWFLPIRGLLGLCLIILILLILWFRRRRS